MSDDGRNLSDFLEDDAINGITVSQQYRGGLVAGFYVGEENDDTQRCLIVLPNDIQYPLNWDDARRECAKLQIDGYSDWRLPTKSELDQMYKKRGVLGDFLEEGYWSSSLFDNNRKAEIVVFNKAQHTNYECVNESQRVRPVRVEYCKVIDDDLILPP